MADPTPSTHPILQELIAALEAAAQSPEGQALIQALIALLIPKAS